MHILINCSRSQDNQAMEFGELIEYNMRIEHNSESIV